MRVAIYVRLSKADDKSTSIELQTEQCLSYAERKGWEVVETFIDDGVSGFQNVKRAHRDEMLSRLDELDVILFSRQDRLTRDNYDYARIVHDCEQQAVRLVSVTGAVDLTSDTGRLMGQIGASVAEHESRTISARIKSSQRHLATIGRWRGGLAPFGFTPVVSPDGIGKVLVIVDSEADAIRSMYQHAMSGESMKAIARHLNESEVPTRTGSPWAGSTVFSVLKRRTTTGQAVHRRQPVRDDEGNPVCFSEPILTVHEWQSVQQAITARRRPGKITARSQLLRGVIYCGACLRPLVSRRARRPKKGDAANVHLRYGCIAYSNAKNDCPAGGRSISARLSEPEVINSLLERHGYELVTKAATSTDPDAAEREHLEASLSDFVQQVLNKQMTPELFGRVGGEIEAQLKELPTWTGVDRVQISAETVSDVWESASLRERNAMLRARMAILLGDKVVGQEATAHLVDDATPSELLGQAARLTFVWPSAALSALQDKSARELVSPVE